MILDFIHLKLQVMKLKITGYILLLALCFALLNCEDDKELASIVGKWQGEEVDLKVNIIPIKSTDLQLTLDFRPDGTLVYTENNLTLNGTYEMDGATLRIAGIENSRLPIEISGAYAVKELGDSRLVIEGEREGEIEDPTYGTVSGKVKATFSFNRISS